MPRNDLPFGTLILLLQHQLTGNRRAGRQAAELLDRLADGGELDRDTAGLCRKMRERLEADLAAGHP